ncbi:hypothetical protein GCM10027298_01700 [Epidermidibacterium keratini]
MHHAVAIYPLPGNPGLLHDVFGVGDTAEGAVGDAKQSRAQYLELVDWLIGHRRTSQRSAKP